MSTSTFAEQMLQYAIESGEVVGENPVAEDPSLIGAEEITIVTDNTMTELEEALEETSEKVEKLEDNGAGAEKIMDAVESLESYVASLKADREAGLPLTAQSAKYFTMGVVASLEGRDIPAEIFNAEVGALQTSFESNGADCYSVEAEEKAEGLLTRLWNMLKAAANAIATAFKEFFTTIGKSARAIQASGTKLKRVSGTLKGDLKDGKISIGKQTRLGADPVKALTELKTHYTQDVLGITKEIRGVLGNLATVLTDPTAEKIASWETSIASKAPSSKTVVLPGFYSLKYVAGQGSGLSGLSGAQFSVVASGSEGAAVSEIAPLTPAQIGTLGGKLEEIGKLMEAASKDADAIVAENTKLISAADKTLAKAKGGTPEQVAAARKALSMAKTAINANKGLIPAYVRHLGAAAKEAYSVGVASARKYGGTVEGAAVPAAE